MSRLLQRLLFVDVESAEYLGFCEQKGYVYTYNKADKHTIIAIKNNEVSTLISYTVRNFC